MGDTLRTMIYAMMLVAASGCVVGARNAEEPARGQAGPARSMAAIATPTFAPGTGNQRPVCGAGSGLSDLSAADGICAVAEQ